MSEIPKYDRLSIPKDKRIQFETDWNKVWTKYEDVAKTIANSSARYGAELATKVYKIPFPEFLTEVAAISCIALSCAWMLESYGLFSSVLVATGISSVFVLGGRWVSRKLLSFFNL